MAIVLQVYIARLSFARPSSMRTFHRLLQLRVSLVFFVSCLALRQSVLELQFRQKLLLPLTCSIGILGIFAKVRPQPKNQPDRRNDPNHDYPPLPWRHRLLIEIPSTPVYHRSPPSRFRRIPFANTSLDNSRNLTVLPTTQSGCFQHRKRKARTVPITHADRNRPFDDRPRRFLPLAFVLLTRHLVQNHQ